MTNYGKIGIDLANKFGAESNIKMDTSDARYRYYQWLLSWFGFDTKETTNKCPFYQLMFWGSLVILVSIIPIIIMKFVDIFILKPLNWNHCPAIDFTYKINEKGTFQKFNDNIIFIGKKFNVLINNIDFPGNWGDKKSINGRLECLLCTKDSKDQYGYIHVYEVIKVRIEKKEL